LILSNGAVRGHPYRENKSNSPAVYVCIRSSLSDAPLTVGGPGFLLVQMKKIIVGVPAQALITISATSDRTMTLAREGSVDGLILDVENVERLVYSLRSMEARMRKHLEEMQDAEEQRPEPRKTK